MQRLDRKATGTSLDYICDLNRRLSQDIKYLIRMEPGVQTPDETLAQGSGSCRDTGWLLVQILRRLGLAARFVSGYLIQLKPDVKPLDGPAGTDKDFTDLHAWAEVYLPGAGWIGLDPTSGLVAGEGHIPLAATPSPSSAAPISGAHDEAKVEFDFEMSVTRIRETPRVTMPYSDAQWADIVDVGHAVDKRLLAGDVRLSMGGEPTFVSIDDMDGAEWNNAAVGPTKQRYAEDLVRRLTARFAPGGLLHYGQGKWYPGEQLPRWSYAVYWRTDGEPLWAKPELIDREQPQVPATIKEAESYAAELCRQLGLPADAPIAAFEDPGHFALAEQKLPLGVDPATNKLDDPAERARLVSVFSRGLSKPSGYVLPIQVWQTQDRGRRWVTERWKLRRERLFLAPGDSPVGFRLPLGSLPYIAPINYPNVEPADPFAPRERLPDRTTLQQQRRAVTLQPPAIPAEPTDEVIGAVRTALVVEPRDGHLCVFLPPVTDAEDYAALVAALEATAEKTNLTVRLEGYAPPPDPRLNVIKVTPDPGVIEVNIHPTTELARSGRRHDRALRGSAPDPARRREIHARRAPHRHRRRQPHRARRQDACRQPVPAAARSAGQRHQLLAEPPVAVVPVLGAFHRADQPGTAHRRSAPRPALRAGDRARRSAEPARPADAAVAGRPHFPQSPHRCHRQYASGRDLHRQAVFTR